MNFEKIPAIKLNLTKETDKRIIRQTMNKLRGKHDLKKDADEFLAILKANEEQNLFATSGINEFDFFKTLQKSIDLKDLDRIPDLTEDDSLTKEGDIWQLGEHKLLCGDSTKDISKLMQNDKADLFLTDPPYGINYSEKNTAFNKNDSSKRFEKPIANDNLKIGELSQFLFSAFSNANLFCKEGASYYIFSVQGGELMLAFFNAILNSGWQLKHQLIWAKNHFVLARGDYSYQHEPILFGWNKGTHKFYGPRGVSSIWKVDKPSSSKLHPTQKPVELAERALLNSTLEGDIILDLFAGSGFSLIASQKLKRIWRGVELDPNYCDVIVKRFEEYTGIKAFKLA